MKKKLLVLITIIIVASVLCVSLVACDDSNYHYGPTPIVFDEAMSVEDLDNAICVAQNFTLELEVIAISQGNGTYYLGNTYSCFISDNMMSWEFIEDGRYYSISEKSDGTQSEISIKEYNDDEHENSTLSSMTDMKRTIREMLLKDDAVHTIEDGALKISDGRCSIVVKDCNSTKMPSVPEKYKDYKNMAITAE